MRICQIVPWFPSLNPTTIESRQGIFWYKQAIKLGERGHSLKVITIKWPGQTDYERISDHIEVFRIPYVFCIAKFPLPRLMRLTSKITEVCKSWDPDLILYTHMEYLTSLPSIYLKGRLKKPVIMTIDSIPGINWFCGNRVVDMIGFLNSTLISKRVFKAADGIQFLSSDLYRFVPTMGIDSKKIFLITTGVDTEMFKPCDDKCTGREKLGIDNDDVVILFVGRLELIKGIDYLASAAKTIVGRYDHVKFLIIGDGSLREKYEAELKPVSDRVIFAGYRDDIPELMGMSDIFLLTSFSEGAPNVVMEASSSGLPVVSTCVGEVPQLIADGMTGILITPKSMDETVTALSRLIDDPLLRKTMGENGRKRMVQEYSWDVVCHKVETELGRVIDRFKNNH